MKQKFLLKSMLLLCMIVGGVSNAWATEEVYKTALFGSTYNSKGVSGYSGVSFDATNSGFKVNVANFNNNNNGWSFIKCGSSKGAYTGTIITDAAIDKAITKVTLTIDAITTANVTSMTLYTSTNKSSWTSAGTFDKSTGAKTVELGTPTANLYYKIEVVCTKGTSNGLVTVSKVEYYYNAKSNPSLSVSPTSLSLGYGETKSFTVSKTGDGELTVESNNTSVATVEAVAGQYNVTYVGEGSTTISVSSSETSTYASDSKSVTITAADARSAAGLSYTNASESAVIAAGTTHKQTLTNPNSLAVTYTSSDETVATVASDGTVTLKKAGTVTITASFAGNASYKPGSASYTLTITNKHVADLVFGEDALEKLTTDAAFTNDWETDPTGLDVVFSSSDLDVATVNGSGEVTIVGAGTTTITATINDASYEATQFNYTLTVSKADAPISFSASTAEVALDETESFVAPTLSNPQSLTITYSSSDANVASVNSSTGAITFLKAGSTTITATSTENATYNSGAVSYTLTVNKAAETLPFSHTFISGSGFGDFTTSASGIWTTHSTYGAVAQGSTDGTWLYSPIINLTDETYATLTFSHATNGVTTPLADNATLWVKEVGGDWNKLTLSYSNNSSWTYVDQEISLNSYCGKKIQLGFKYISSNTTGKWEIKNFRVADDREEAPISFTDATVYKLLSDAGTYTGQALTNSESLTVSYASSNTDVATVNASTGVVTIKAVGETNITATYAETASYKANTATYKLVVTAKAAAEIEYVEATATKKITQGTYTHTLTNPNSLTVAYTSSDPTVATVNASTGEVTMLKVGETTITATFTENEDYDGAVVSYTLTVIKDDPTLSFAKSAVTVGLADGTYAQAVTTTPAELPVTYSSSDETVGTVASDGTVTLLKAGSTTITASFVGNALYNSANTSYTLAVAINYATLPFSYNSGKSGIGTELTDDKVGFMQSGLGTDYSSSTAPNTQLKFDTQGDYAILKIAEVPGTLSFSIKGNGFSGGTFKVQTSTDGSVYTDLASYTSLGDTQEESFNLAGNVRYVKWIYTSRSSGNVGLGNISLTKTNTITLAEACTDGSKYYGTYSLGKAFVVPEGLTVSTVGLDNEGKLKITDYTTGDVVKANTGVLVSATTAGAKTVTVSAETGIENDGNLLKPSGDAGITAVNMAEDDTKFYRLTMHNGTQLGFWWGAADGAEFALAANKAYLAVPEGAGVREGLWFGDDATSISEECRVKSEKFAPAIYDLQGRKVAQPKKGLYIVNGKKVVMK